MEGKKNRGVGNRDASVQNKSSAWYIAQGLQLLFCVLEIC